MSGAHISGIFLNANSDISPKLRKKLYRGKQGPGNHHIVYFYAYGKNSFQAVPFKNVLPWTSDNTEKLAKLITKGKGARLFARTPGGLPVVIHYPVGARSFGHTQIPRRRERPSLVQRQTSC